MSRRCVSMMLPLVLATLLVLAQPARADKAALPGTRTLATKHAFDALVTRVEAAVEKNQMGLVAQASASRGAAGRGVKIPLTRC